MLILNRKNRLIFEFIILVELFSIYGFLLPDFRQITFFVIVGLALILSLKDLKYGIYILLVELFIGSKGYLFYFEKDKILISIRIALWLVVMAVWLGQILYNKKPSFKYLKFSFKKNNYFKYFSVLFIFILWGFLNGLLNQNGFSNIFFDFNGWLYFALIFPIYSVFKSKKNQKMLWQIFTASIIWLSLKTFFLLFVVSHNIVGVANELYHWVRVTGVGEITQVQGGFFRVFFQSHIFVLAGFFIFLALIFLNNKKLNKKPLAWHFLLLILFLSVTLITFSRSFWVGLIVGLIFVGGVTLYLYNWKRFFITLGFLILSVILSVGLVITIVKFPYPEPTGGFSTTSLLSQRISQADESAISSRWALLPELWSEIKQTPILGQGFGATVTYKTQDPRVLESNPEGEYTTYAFEWGWLDIWLKLGLFGALSYLALILKLTYDGFSVARNKILGNRNSIILALAIGLITISATSLFSPYLNHPLGIGYLILFSAILANKKDLH